MGGLFGNWPKLGIALIIIFESLIILLAHRLVKWRDPIARNQVKQEDELLTSLIYYDNESPHSTAHDLTIFHDNWPKDNRFTDLRSLMIIEDYDSGAVGSSNVGGVVNSTNSANGSDLNFGDSLNSDSSLRDLTRMYVSSDFDFSQTSGAPVVTAVLVDQTDQPNDQGGQSPTTIV